jgi:hypothetical protein
MESQLVFGFVLHVDGRPASVGLSFDEAKVLATPHIANNEALQIISSVAPAPSRIWNYDYAVHQWVELVRA